MSKALGKGIGALIPTAPAAPENISLKENGRRGESIIYVQSERIRPNPFQPREEFNQENISELSQSIKEKGVIQPLLVRRKGDNFELIAGERRFRAANMLGLKELPIIVKDASDQDSLELALIENIQRENLNPIEEAKAYLYLIEKFNLTQDKISSVLGKARATVANTLRLLKLPREIRDELKKGRISFGHGRALLEVTDENLQRKLAQEVISKNLSVRELENLIKKRRPSFNRIKSLKPAADQQTAILEEQLQQALATKVRIVKRKKRGHILIEFYSEEELNRIVSIFRGGKI